MNAPKWGGCWCCWRPCPNYVDGLRGAWLPPICWKWDKDCTCLKGCWEEPIVAPSGCTQCGLNPTFCCGVEMGWLPADCWPKGWMPPTGPNDGLFPSCCELEPEKARPTFCGPNEVFVFQFHPNGRSAKLLEVGLGLKLPPRNGGKPPLPGWKRPTDPSVN